MQGMVIGIE